MKILSAGATLVMLVALGLVVVGGCAPPPIPAPVESLTPASGAQHRQKTYKDLIVGYAQLGAESEWRSANTASVKEAAADLGVELKFADAQQKQENQIKAIRSFIAQQVDVIGVAPLVEEGWDDVFKEAKDAGIPIILVDRRADVSPDLYVTFIGSDFLEEGRNAARIMAQLTDGKANIVELQGTRGSAPANDRFAGFREILKDYPEMKIIDTEDGNFTVAKGKEVMQAFLKAHGRDITAVFAHNDDMALGAIQAIEQYGLKPGVDITIVSVDAARGAFDAMLDGKLNATVECNPLLGPQFFELALKVANGEPVPKWIPSQESEFLASQGTEALKQIMAKRKY
jgi:simple sugar transport system substrate-binding protein